MRTFKIYSLSNLQIYNTVNYIHHAVGYILRTYSSHHWNFIPFDHTHSIYTQFEHTTLISLPRPKSYSHQSVFYNYEFRFCFLDDICMQAFLLAQLVKKSACNEGDMDLITGLGRSPGEGKCYHFSIPAWRIPWSL